MFLCPLCHERAHPWWDDITDDGAWEHRRVPFRSRSTVPVQYVLGTPEGLLRFDCNRRKHSGRPFRYGIDVWKVRAAVQSAVRDGRRELVLGEDF